MMDFARCVLKASPGIRRICAVLFSALLTIVLSTFTLQQTDPFADIPEVTVQYYDIEGRTADEIRSAMGAARPLEDNSGRHFDGLTKVDYAARWRSDGEGICRSAPEDIEFSIVVILPRLIGEDTPPRLRARFDRYLETLIAHEAGHVEIALEGRDAMQRILEGSDCDTIEAELGRTVDIYAERSRAFDEETRHGATTIIPFYER